MRQKSAASPSGTSLLARAYRFFLLVTTKDRRKKAKSRLRSLHATIYLSSYHTIYVSSYTKSTPRRTQKSSCKEPRTASKGAPSSKEPRQSLLTTGYASFIESSSKGSSACESKRKQEYILVYTGNQMSLVPAAASSKAQSFLRMWAVASEDRRPHSTHECDDAAPVWQKLNEGEQKRMKVFVTAALCIQRYFRCRKTRRRQHLQAQRVEAAQQQLLREGDRQRQKENENERKVRGERRSVDRETERVGMSLRMMEEREGEQGGGRGGKGGAVTLRGGKGGGKADCQALSTHHTMPYCKTGSGDDVERRKRTLSHTHTHKHRAEEDFKAVNTAGRGYTFLVLKSNGGKATLSPVSLPEDQRALSTRNPHRYAAVS